MARFSRQISGKLLSNQEAIDLLAEIQRLPLRTLPTAELCARALQLSQTQGISVYDACYLALALRLGATLLTADGRLQAAARRVGCGG